MIVVALFALLPSLEPYAGTYKVVPEECEEIRPAVERAVAKMNFLIRGIARSRLLKTQIRFPSITVTSDPSEFQIRHDGGTDIAHADLTTPIRTKAPDGASIVVRLSPGPPLTESYEASDGKRENTYTLSEDGSKLILRVRVTSPRLPEEIRYRLVYKRVE
jgi:hypothetical protein